MKVAFTSTTGEKIDEHFGTATHFHIWDIYPDRTNFVGTVSAIAGTGDEEDRISARANAVADCVIVYTLQIGGPAAAKLVSRRVHPMKTTTEVAVAEVVEKLQGVLRSKPPPWLRKAMEKDAAPASAERG
jgi:nitrogen fixation protein NifX